MAYATLRDMNYMDVCKDIYPNNADIRCTGNNVLLLSLASDGYDEWTRLSSEEEVQRFKNGGTDNAGLTSYAGTGSIYLQELEAYYSIDIHKETSDVFYVSLKHELKCYYQTSLK